MEDNILYDYISDVEGKNVNAVFDLLLDKQEINENDLIQILAEDNNYLMDFKEENSETRKDLKKMVEAINSAYKIGKLNFIWDSKLKEEKKNIENQLNGVSKAIFNIAEDLRKETVENEDYDDERKQIIFLLKQKEILTQEITIKKDSSRRFVVELYLDDIKIKDKEKIIEEILTKVLKEKILITSQENLKSEK